MTRIRESEDIGPSDEDTSKVYLGTRSTEHLPEPPPELTTQLPLGSSHTRIKFIAQPESDTNSGEQTRHRSPPPQPTELGGWANDIDADLPTTYEPWQSEDLAALEDQNNEKMWWNPHSRAALRPLGPGMLPVLAASKIHDETHELIKVSVSYPNYPSTDRSEASHPAPTLNDLYHAIPHQNAYYCAKCNGWVVVQKSRTIMPPVYSKYNEGCPELNFPLNRNLQRDYECNQSSETYNQNPDKAHHYHLYEDAIPGVDLNPALVRDSWEQDPPLPRKVCRHHIGSSENFWKAPMYQMMEIEPDAADRDMVPGDYLDLYACCQCMTNIYVTRQTISGVVSPRLLADLHRERAAGGEGAVRVAIALEFVHRLIESLLWGVKVRPVKYEGVTFSKSFGEDAQALMIWEELGYTIDRENKTLVPPNLTDPSAYRRLLRAWVELGAYTADYLRKNPNSVAIRVQKNLAIHKLAVRVHSATDELAEMIGSHPNQIPRGLIEAPHASFDPVFHGLGLTQSSYTPQLLCYAYRMQARCDITHLPIHLEELINLADHILPQLRRDDTLVSEDVRELIVMERSKDRWTPKEYEEAISLLQLGPDSPLLVTIFEADAGFLERAYKELLNQTYRPPESAPSTWSDDVKMKMEPTERRQQLKDALRIAAEGTGKEEFYQVWKKINEPWSSMDPEKAYTTLGVPNDTTDEMLLTVYSLRVEDAPLSMERMKEALSVLAEARDSSRLREFLRSGTDPGEAGMVVLADWPRGLNQLGNTCYLNSLLQYFYTIKDLRQVILSMKTEGHIEAVSKEKLSDAQLQKHRVGGRLVTRKEIERSRHFLAQLSNLFTDMAWADSNAVTPSLELAKLALVTSKDEEEDEAKANPSGTAGTSSSASTDATLVEDAIPGPLTASSGIASASVPAAAPSLSTTTILGKRPRETDMDIDEHNEGGSSSKPRSRSEDSPPPDKAMRLDGPNTSRTIKETRHEPEHQDVDMEDAEVSSIVVSAGASVSGSRVESPIPGNQTITETSTSNQPPPLPKRQPPPLPPRKQPASDSVMMFGKQHDVAECMDNCMFQIETALLDFEGQVSADSDKTSIIKRLFYGKMRQRITPIVDGPLSQDKPTVNVKDDLFSHLPVNVSDEGFDIYDGLGGYFQDNVDFEGNKATMEVTLIELPQIMQIQLQRVQFNRETLQPYKSQAYVKFSESLYMDRWLEDADPDKKARAKEIQGRLSACRDRINTLTVEHGVSMVDALKSTAVFMQTQTVSELKGMDGLAQQLSETVAKEAMCIEDELKALRAEVADLKLELEALWQDEHMAEYELTSVFIHRGSSPSWGHYFFYARNLPDKPDEWFKYNDSSVTMAKREEVLADTTGSTANPYLLVFARKGSGVVHTVNRHS